MIANPDAVVFPPLPDGSVDTNLRLETHSYDPWGFCGAIPPTQQTWGSASDVAAVMQMCVERWEMMTHAYSLTPYSRVYGLQVLPDGAVVGIAWKSCPPDGRGRLRLTGPLAGEYM